jgi:hypothetical protein
LISEVSLAIASFFGLIALKATNPWVAQDQGSKFAHVGSTMTTLTKVQTSSLVNTMSIHQ